MLPSAIMPGQLTKENIHTLTQTAQIERGVPVESFWPPDDEAIALAAGTGVYLFDGHTLDFFALLPSGYARQISWSADGTLLAVYTSQGDEIQLWNAAEQRLLFSIEQTRIISALWVNQEKGELLALGQQEAGTGKYGVTFYKSCLDTYSLKNGNRKKVYAVLFPRKPSSDDFSSLVSLALNRFLKCILDF